MGGVPATPLRDPQWQPPIFPPGCCFHCFMMQFPLPTPPPSATFTEMEALEDWELLGDGAFPAPEGRPPRAPPVPVGAELVAQKNPGEEFVRGINEIEVAATWTPSDRELDAPSATQLASCGKPLTGAAGRNSCDERGEGEEEDGVEGGGQGPPGQEGGKDKNSEIEVKGCWEGFGFGAVCTIGAAAAATIALLMLSGGQRQKHHQQIHKLHFRTRHDEKVGKSLAFPGCVQDDPVCKTSRIPSFGSFSVFRKHSPNSPKPMFKL